MHRKYTFIMMVILAITLSACIKIITSAPAEMPTAIVVPTMKVENTLKVVPTENNIPFLAVGVATSAQRTLEDADASLRASEKRAISGDDFLNNLYERPFTSKTMEYEPDINILTVSIASDSEFYYFTITLQGFEQTTNKLTGTYGIEFDRTKTGRGDLLVEAHDLKEDWSTDNVNVYIDKNKDVGGYKPIVAEEGFKGNGYETEVKMEGDKVAYAHSVSGDTPTVEIAVSHALLGDAKEFLWGGWADKGVNDPKKFDYDDYFGPTAAGSPIKTSSDYPLAALYSVDNTCRLPFGFERNGNIPGMCKNYVPPEEKGPNCVCTHWNVTRYPAVCTSWSCS